MEIIAADEAYRDQWLEMRVSLWPECPREESNKEISRILTSNRESAVLALADSGEVIGFAEVSTREYVDGCTSTPVGYLEGLYVRQEHRHRGVGARLVEAGEEWSRDRGCSEMGSDTDVGNHASRAAHASAGYREVEEAIHFAKALRDEAPAVAEGPGRGAFVSLREIDDDNVRAVIDLNVADAQRAFVAPNAVSLAQAYATTMVWPRAVYADDAAVGFAMLSDDHERPRYYLWRFMIDRRHQGKGFGRAAMELVEEYVRSRPGGDRLFLSYVPAQGGPEGFYRSLGYEDTGREKGGEREMVKEL